MKLKSSNDLSPFLKGKTGTSYGLMRYDLIFTYVSNAV